MSPPTDSHSHKNLISAVTPSHNIGTKKQRLKVPLLCCTWCLSCCVSYLPLHLHLLLKSLQYTFQMTVRRKTPVVSHLVTDICFVLYRSITISSASQKIEKQLFFYQCLLVGCLTSQQQASVSQGRICSDNFTCCHTEIEVADQTFYLTQSQYTDTGPTSPSADPITPGAWQGSHWSANF